jgi:hypothetical protein
MYELNKMCTESEKDFNNIHNYNDILLGFNQGIDSNGGFQYQTFSENPKVIVGAPFSQP